MNFIRTTRLLAILLGLLIAATGFAQEAEDSPEPTPPDPRSLDNNWWVYFSGPRDETEPRIDSFLDAISADTAELEPQNQEIAQSILESLRDNLNAYVVLLDETAPTPEELPPEAEGYSIGELLALAANARAAQSDAADRELEVEREQRILDGASRRRDVAFRDYLDAEQGDARWITAIRLFQSRSAQAISARRLELLTARYDNVAAYAETADARVDLARERLAITVEDAGLDELIQRVATEVQNVADSEEALRAAEVAAIDLELDTAQGLSQQRLQQDRVLGAEVELALASVNLGQAQAERWWTELQLDIGTDTGELVDLSLDWSELIRSIEQNSPEWKRDTQDELLAVQGMNRDGLDRESRRLLDQRVGTAQEILGRVGELEAGTADLALLSQVVDRAVAETTGPFRSWLAGLSRDVRTFYLRTVSLTEFTLFSVGETPITGGGIMRVIVIMLFAFLLSRIIRHAIMRVSPLEQGGRQASLYTVARLTHYLIVVVALIIALSTIGLDFSNLALVAGALSVGIGFGLQSIVSNFISGLIILFEQTLRVGDYIELDTGLTGTVKAINVRSTLINTNDNIDIVVPNSEFVTSRLKNWTLGERILRVRIPFGVAYGSDKELVKKAAMEAAEEVPYTLTHMSNRVPDVWLVEFGDNSLNFLLTAWVNRQGARRPTRTRAAYLWALETKLSEYGIEIPFPQRDLHLRSGWPAASKSPEPQPAPD